MGVILGMCLLAGLMLGLVICSFGCFGLDTSCLRGCGLARS